MNTTGPVLVFARTRSRARRVAHEMSTAGTSAPPKSTPTALLSQRRAALDGFKSGKYRVLVATDIAARGIDVTGIELVLNYDLPDQRRRLRPPHWTHRPRRANRPRDLLRRARSRPRRARHRALDENAARTFAVQRRQLGFERAQSAFDARRSQSQSRGEPAKPPAKQCASRAGCTARFGAASPPQRPAPLEIPKKAAVLT